MCRAAQQRCGTSPGWVRRSCRGSKKLWWFGIYTRNNLSVFVAFDFCNFSPSAAQRVMSKESCHLVTSCGNCSVCNTKKPQAFTMIPWLAPYIVTQVFWNGMLLVRALVYINIGYWPPTVKFQMHYGCSHQMLNGKSRLVHPATRSVCVLRLTSVSSEECSICVYSCHCCKVVRLVFFWKFKVAGLWRLGVVWVLGECKRWPDKNVRLH